MCYVIFLSRIVFLARCCAVAAELAPPTGEENRRPRPGLNHTSWEGCPEPEPEHHLVFDTKSSWREPFELGLFHGATPAAQNPRGPTP